MRSEGEILVTDQEIDRLEAAAQAAMALDPVTVLGLIHRLRLAETRGAGGGAPFDITFDVTALNPRELLGAALNLLNRYSGKVSANGGIPAEIGHAIVLATAATAAQLFLEEDNESGGQPS